MALAAPSVLLVIFIVFVPLVVLNIACARVIALVLIPIHLTSSPSPSFSWPSPSPSPSSPPSPSPSRSSSSSSFLPSSSPHQPGRPSVPTTLRRCSGLACLPPGRRSGAFRALFLRRSHVACASRIHPTGRQTCCCICFRKCARPRRPRRLCRALFAQRTESVRRTPRVADVRRVATRHRVLAAHGVAAPHAVVTSHCNPPQDVGSAQAIRSPQAMVSRTASGPQQVIQSRRRPLAAGHGVTDRHGVRRVVAARGVAASKGVVAGVAGHGAAAGHGVLGGHGVATATRSAQAMGRRRPWNHRGPRSWVRGLRQPHGLGRLDGMRRPGGLLRVDGLRFAAGRRPTTPRWLVATPFLRRPHGLRRLHRATPLLAATDCSSFRNRRNTRCVFLRKCARPR